MPMGTWYVATLLTQQQDRRRRHVQLGHRAGAAVRPSTTGTSKTPVTFGDPTGLGDQPAISKRQDRRGQGVPRATRPAPEAREGARGHRHHPGRHRRRGRPQTYFALRRACRPTTCRSSPGPSTTSSRRTRCRSTPPALQNILNDAALGGAVRQQAASTRAISDARGPGQERGPQPVTRHGLAAVCPVRGPPHAGHARGQRPQEKHMATMVEAPRRRRRQAPACRLVWRNTAGRMVVHPAELHRLRRAHPGAGRGAVLRRLHQLERLRRTPTWVGTDNFAPDVARRTASGPRCATPSTTRPSTSRSPWSPRSGLALLLNRKLRGVAFFRTVAFFPYITSIVAIA